MGLPGVSLAADLQLTLLLLGAVAGGTVLGTATGLVPGLHANNVALVLASVAVGLPGPPLAIAAAMLSAGVAHTFLNAIPALAIGVPDAEMAVSALPGHRLVRNGRGREAIRLSVLGSALAVVVAVPLAIPITGLMMRGYPLIVEHLRVVLTAVVVGMLAMEQSRRSRIAGALTFTLAAGLGWQFLDADPAAPLSAGGVLAPLFAGLFGAPILLEAMRGGGVPPQGDAAICSRPSGVGATALAGTVAGAIVGYLPGISAAIAAVAVLVAMPGDVTDRGYLVATSGVDTANSIFALFALWAIGSPRTGVLVGVDQLGAPLNVPVLTASVLLAGGFAAGITLVVGDRYLQVVGGLDHRLVAGGVLCFLVGISFLFAGALGVGLFLAATLVGLIPACRGVPRPLHGRADRAVARGGVSCPWIESVGGIATAPLAGGKTTLNPGAVEPGCMSESRQKRAQKCVSCGINVAGTNAASFDCPECGTGIHRCAKCRKQSNLYKCPSCGFTGP